MEHIEVAIVGAGPGGMSAALTLAEEGVEVAIIDNNPTPGGQYYRQTYINNTTKKLKPHQQEGVELRRKLHDSKIRYFSKTNVWGTFEQKILALDGPGAPPALEAEAIVLATGAFERTIAFPGWTLPGVITIGAAQILNENNVSPGKRVLISGTGPLLVVLASELIHAGIEVIGVLEGSNLLPRAIKHLGALFGQKERLKEGIGSWISLQKHRIPYRLGCSVCFARGEDHLKEVTFCHLDNDWKPIPGSEETVSCDTLCIGYGFIPFNALSVTLGVEQEWDPFNACYIPKRNMFMETNIKGVYSIGDGTSIGGARLALLEGQIAGVAAAQQLGKSKKHPEKYISGIATALSRERRFKKMYTDIFTPGFGIYELSEENTILCRCEGITTADIRRAIDLGADTSGEIKIITRAGMGDCQGRMCSHLIANIVARETNKSLLEVGQFQPRPPVFPVPIENLCLSVDKSAGKMG